jgi:hypothetical protein
MPLQNMRTDGIRMETQKHVLKNSEESKRAFETVSKGEDGTVRPYKVAYTRPEGGQHQSKSGNNDSVGKMTSKVNVNKQ